MGNDKFSRGNITTIIVAAITAIGVIGAAHFGQGNSDKTPITINLTSPTDARVERKFGSSEQFSKNADTESKESLREALDKQNQRLVALETQVSILREIVVKKVSSVKVIAPRSKITEITRFFPESAFVINGQNEGVNERLPASADLDMPVTLEIMKK